MRSAMERISFEHYYGVVVFYGYYASFFLLKLPNYQVTTQSSSLEQRKNRKNNGKTEYIVP